jgi:hypothetical protein
MMQQVNLQHNLAARGGLCKDGVDPMHMCREEICVLWRP